MLLYSEHNGGLLQCLGWLGSFHSENSLDFSVFKVSYLWSRPVISGPDGALSTCVQLGVVLNHTNSFKVAVSHRLEGLQLSKEVFPIIRIFQVDLDSRRSVALRRVTVHGLYLSVVIDLTFACNGLFVDGYRVDVI